MNAIENIKSLYNRTGYEFLPIEINPCPIISQKITAATGGKSLAEYYDYEMGFMGAGVVGLKRKNQQDINWRDFYEEELHEDTCFSDYGKASEGGFESAAHMRRAHHPMASFDSLSQLEDYPWPEWDGEDVAHVKEHVDKMHFEGRYVTASMECTIWETAWGLRDMTVLMMDMMSDESKASYIFDKITADVVQKAKVFAEAGVDLFDFGDDIGMQHSIMMSVDMYREWLKPRLAQVIDAVKSVNPDVLVKYHSCGFVEPYIPDLLDVGVDILNPVQPECMSFEKLYSQYGDVLSFNGTLGTQTTMPFGTPEDVRDVVFKNLDIAGEKGGLVVAPTHMLEPEVPWENIDAFIKACIDYCGI
jgi:uroporphyrinogen decarboxylase